MAPRSLPFYENYSSESYLYNNYHISDRRGMLSQWSRIFLSIVDAGDGHRRDNLFRGFSRYARSLAPWGGSERATSKELHIHGVESHSFRHMYTNRSFERIGSLEGYSHPYESISGSSSAASGYGEKSFSKRRILSGKRAATPVTMTSSLEKLSKEKSKQLLASRRIVIVKNISSHSGINGLLAQVCGGPLERVSYHNIANSSFAILHFIYPSHAKEFYKYGTSTGFLVLNGSRLSIEWAHSFDTDIMKPMHPPMSEVTMQEFLENGARRCLILSQAVPDKDIRKESRFHYPNVKTHFSQGLSISQVRQDFSVYGTVVEIGSVLSKKLSFSIHFTDINSAINAKYECELPNTIMNKKYGEWTIWFGKDPTDKPCIRI